MLIEHEGRSPQVDPGAWVAPTAVLCGDVRVASGARSSGTRASVGDGAFLATGESIFPGTVLGVARGTSAAEITRGYAELFGRHRDYRVID